MYAVTCSSCSHVEKSPFARVGAVMVCPSCKSPVQLRVEDVKHQVKLRTEGDDDLFKLTPLAVEEAAAATTALEEPTVKQTTTIKASDLEIHEDQAELAHAASRRAETQRKQKPKAQAITRPGLSSGELAQHLAQKRKKKTMLVGGGVALAAVIGLVVLLSSMGGNGTGPGKDTNKDGNLAVIPDPLTPKDGSAVTSKDATKDATKDGSTPLPVKDSAITKDAGKSVDPTKDKSVPVPPAAALRITALPLGIDSWQPVNEPFRPVAPGSRVLVINDVREEGGGGGQLFKAQVISQGVASALISVALVNDEDRVYARFERPHFLIDGKTPRPVQLSIPPELWSATSSVYWQVQPIDTHLTNLTLLEDTLAEPIKDEKEVTIKISAYNGSNFQLKDAAFVIQGIDSTGQVASQWRLKFPSAVEARSWLKFEAQLPGAAAKDVNSWRVLGAGLPSGTAVEPPVIEHQPDPKERDPKEPVIPRRGRGLFDF